MSETTPRHPVTLMKVVYQIPGMDLVEVTREIEYRSTDAGPLTLNLLDFTVPPGGIPMHPTMLTMPMVRRANELMEKFMAQISTGTSEC